MVKMQRLAADGPRRVLYYEVQMEGEHPSARKLGAEGWNTHRFRNRAIFSISPQHLLKTLFPQALCKIQIAALPMLQHTYPASRKNSALRVSLFFSKYSGQSSEGPRE